RTRRRGTRTNPNSETFSKAIHDELARSHWGSLYERVTRCGASVSIHAGSIRPTVRTKRRLVSTASPATIHFGFFAKSAEPGQRWALLPPATEYSNASGRKATLDKRPLNSAR